MNNVQCTMNNWAGRIKPKRPACFRKFISGIVLISLVLGLCVLTGAARPAETMPLVIAHRGASLSAPENTIAAYEAAIAMGAGGVETDLMVTRDGEVVLSHDTTIDRCSNGTGLVKDMTLAQLRDYDFGGWFSDEFAGTQIPTLDEFLDCVAGVDLILIELKTNEGDIAAKTVAALQARGMMEQVLFQSFDMEAIQACKDADPAAEIALLYSKDDDWDTAAKADIQGFCEEYRLTALHPHYKAITGRFMRDCDAAGISVRTWTLNKESQQRKAARQGVAGIITDQVELTQGTLAKLSSAGGCSYN